MSYPKLVENPHIMDRNPCWFIAVFIAASGFHSGKYLAAPLAVGAGFPCTPRNQPESRSSECSWPDVNIT